MLKRLFDIVASIFGLLILSPFLVLLAIIVKQKHGSPILFKQIRPGKDGKPFVFFKFRSMNNEMDKEGGVLPDKDRLTSFGSFLRGTSLDELPSLFNVLRGDMSLVGPRPLLMKYIPLRTTLLKTLCFVCLLDYNSNI